MHWQSQSNYDIMEQIPEDHKLVSFDVKSLFTSIPLQLALDCTKTAINKSPYQPLIPTDDLMDLLHLCLTSTYCQYNGKHYKQLHGTARAPPATFFVHFMLFRTVVIGNHLIISVNTSHKAVVIMYNLQLPDLVALPIPSASVDHVCSVNG